MPDIIRLLPDSIANQIAAGEVIQRPASVVKELLDNAVDAGATTITVILKDAGKTLIHVMDDGSGMSPADARMSLERHATSKLRSADDLFDIRTMGFRGEALASIAAIAHMEIRTRRADDTIGTRLLVEASEVVAQEGCASPTGTSVMVRNLFFNVPARRKFLKTDQVEMRHLLDEFHHLALAFEHIHFKLYHNDQEVYNLPAGTLRNRILGIFGRKINEFLVPVEEETNYVNFAGYVGKPKLGRKTRGEQFLFVNRRFIRSPYLHHAVKSAYEDILPADQHPFYVLFLEIDPQRIDVNVHPTKQEIKFEDDRVIYNYLRVATRHALGKYSIIPSLDFEQETSLERAAAPATTATGQLSRPPGWQQQEKANIEKWRSLLQTIEGFSLDQPADASTESGPAGNPLLDVPVTEPPREALVPPTQLWQRYIVFHGLTELYIIDQRAAHERVLFERMTRQLAYQPPATQRLLWPETLTCTPAEHLLYSELLPHLQALGFDIDEFGQDAYIIHGIPALMTGHLSALEALEEIRDHFDATRQTGPSRAPDRIAAALAFSLSRRRGETMTTQEMQALVEQLLESDNPYTSPSGRKTFITFGQEDIFRRFQS
jgi:DNA mismatch repair protein MutL